MKSLKHALKIFFEEAYKGGTPPKSVVDLADMVSRAKKFSQLVDMEHVESPAAGVVSLRLGNRLYPHMKLVIRKEGDDLHFAVDTHDGPSRIPSDLPGYDRFKAVIEENKRIRKAVQERLRKVFEIGGPDSQTPMSRGCVLVVDDEAFVRDIMGRLLSSFGFEVLSAEYVDRGLELARKNRISCCFLDIMMPEKSGYQFIEELEAKEAREFPIVFVTGMHPKHIRKNVADGVILKPFTASMLQEHLSAFGLF